MKTLPALIWLRWRLAMNEIGPLLLSLSHVLHDLFVALYFMLFFGIGASCSFYINLNTKLEYPEQWFYHANTIVSTLLLFIIILKILSSGEIIKRLNSKTLRYYPIKTVVLYVFDLILRLLDKWYLMTVCFLFGFVSGFGLSINSPLELFSLSFIIFTIIIGLHCIIEIIEEAIQFFFSFSRLARYSLTIVAVILSSLLVNILPIFKNPLALIQKYTSIGFFNVALYGLYDEHKPWIVNQQAWKSFIFVSLLLIILIVVHIFHKAFVVKDSNIKNIRRKIFQLTLERALFFLPQNIAPFIIKDLHYFIRSRTTQVLIVLELVVVSYISYQVGTNSKNYSWFIIIYFLIFCTSNAWIPYLGNIFGMEKDAFAFYLLSPTSIRNLLLSKNISFLILQTPFILWTWLIIGYFLEPLFLPLFILGQVSAFCLIMIYGNISSIESPYPVERYGLIFYRSASGKFSILGFLAMAACMIYQIFFAVMILKLKASLISYMIIATITMLTYWLFHRSKSKAYKIFIARHEAIYKTLRKK